MASHSTEQIGDTFTAVNNTITSFTLLAASQQLASFTELPIGVYSVSVSIPLINNASGEFEIENWTFGASNIDASTLEQLTLGSIAVVSFPVPCIPYEDTYIFDTNFTLNNTTANTPIYINSVFQVGETANAQLGFNSTFSTAAVITATKLA